jgi:hypothetical protein
MRHLALAHALALEINTGIKVSRSYSPMLLAKAQCDSAKRTKKGVLRDYVKWVQTWYPEYQPSDSLKKAMTK